ncbi:MAG: hypothetical protein WAN11_02575 [Syntrophobacteraceae bacterium]
MTLNEKGEVSNRLLSLLGLCAVQINLELMVRPILWQLLQQRAVKVFWS